MLTRFILLSLTASGLLALNAPAAGNPQKTQPLIAVLQSNAPLFDKARACQQLGEFGTAEAVPALAALLGDAHLSAYARSGLEGIPDPSAAEALRAAAGTLKGAPLAGVINSLAALRDTQAVPLLRKLAADPDSGVVREALLALGRISTAESIQVVRQALANGPAALRPEAASACLLAAAQQLTGGQAEMALALYDAVRTANVPAAQRAGATRGAILARKADAVPFLLSQLQSEDRVVRNAALLTVREIPSDALAAALNAELAKAAPELQVQLLTALVDCHNPASLPVIQTKATNPDPAVRKTALTVLGQLGGPAEAGVLIQALTDNRAPDESALALNGLTRLKGTAVDDRIVQALAAANDTTVRVKLIRLLESREATNAVGVLLQQAATPETKASVAALGALRSLAAPTDLPALLELAKTAKDEAVREAAEGAVCGTCTRTGTSGSAGETVLAQLKQSTVPAERNSWIRILTGLGYAPALPTLEAALADPDETVADNALEQLGRWPDPSPVESLLAVVEKGSNPARRKRALGSVIQLAVVATEERQRSNDALVGWFQRANQAAQTLEDRRRLLSGLGRLKHPASLALLIPYLEQPDLQTEAALAIVQIAPSLAKQGDAVGLKGALQKIAATVKNPDLRQKAAKLAQTVPSQNEPTPLFDGRSLAGWDGDTNVWRVRDGIIVGGSLNGNARNEFLAFKRNLTNFVLRLEYKLVGTEGFVNGGVQFRSQRVKQPANEMSGFQADIGAGYSGALYDESRRNKFLVQPNAAQLKRLEKPGDWNRYEVRCAGPRLQILLNGEMTVDYTETDPAIPLFGLIALQIHGACKAEISFRNITLQDLSYGLANRDFGLPKAKWKILSFSSQNTQAEDERAVLAIDDNPDTFWHTLWSSGKPSHPHHLAIDLGEAVAMTGFTYLPRQDGRAEAGVIGEYEFYVSRDGKEWGQAVAKGRFANIDKEATGRVVLLTQPVTGRYLKLVSLSAPGGQPFAGAAEIGVLGQRAAQ